MRTVPCYLPICHPACLLLPLAPYSDSLARNTKGDVSTIMDSSLKISLISANRVILLGRSNNPPRQENGSVYKYFYGGDAEITLLETSCFYYAHNSSFSVFF